MTAEWNQCPILKTELETPVLASDGYTYSLDALQYAITLDPWHRSPVTMEVLRPLVYRNVVIEKLLGVAVPDETPTPILLYTERLGPPPVDGGILTWQLPSLVTPAVAALKLKWGFEGAPLVLRAYVLRDASGQDRLMHPPVFEEMWDDALELAAVFGVHAPNPWCLSTATINGVCVETLWISLRSPLLV